MELNQLKYFQTVARLQNVTHAAAELFISQPNLSTAISRLESDLGVALFERKKGRIKLTSNGEIFLSHVDLALLELDKAMENISEQNAVCETRIVASASFAGILGELFSRYYVDYGLLPSSQLTYPNEIVHNMLLQKRLDMAIMNICPTETEIRWTPVCEDEIVVLLSAKNRYIKDLKSGGLTDFRYAHFVCNEMFLDRASVDMICKDSGFIPNIVMVSNDPYLPGSQPFPFGNNVAMIPLHFLPLILSRSPIAPRVVRLRGYDHKISIGIAQNKGRVASMYTEEFCQFATKEIGKIILHEREIAELLLSEQKLELNIPAL